EIAAGWRAVGVTEPGGTARIDLVRHLLDRDGQRLLEKLRARNDVLVYGFSGSLDELGTLPLVRRGAGDAGAAAPPADAPPGEPPFDLSELGATGSYSNIGGAVREALGRSAASNVAGIVLFSDGRRNLGAQGPEVRRLLEHRGVPTTVVVPVGDPSPTRRLRLVRIEAPEKVFQ